MLSLSGLGDKYLKIVTEQDIGVGVQAVNNIRAHTLVCYYEGELIKGRKSIEKREKEQNYQNEYLLVFFYKGDWNCIDAESSLHTYGRWVIANNNY